MTPGLRPRITTPASGCAGRRCAYSTQCPVLRARNEVREAQIVVTNHALLLSALSIGESDNGQPLIAAPAVLHGALLRPVQLYRAAGVALAETEAVADYPNGHDFAGRLVLAPPSAAGSAWLRRFRRAQQAFASGWMQLRGNRRRRNYDRGFVVSDHADWPALLRTVADSGAQRVFATHGNSEVLVQLLQERGLQAQALQTQYGDEDDEAGKTQAD